MADGLARCGNGHSDLNGRGGRRKVWRMRHFLLMIAMGGCEEKPLVLPEVSDFTLATVVNRGKTLGRAHQCLVL